MKERQSDDAAIFSGAKIAHFRNPLALTARPPEAEAVLPDSLLREAADEIAQWPGFAQTPLVALPGFARKCGVGAVYYKDESGRFGLGSFKALGGAYALLRALAEKLSAPPAEVRDGKHRARAGEVVAVAATDGNHGRAVAWGARRFGCQCRIFIHAGVSENRADAMREFGAEIVRIAGDYDESLLQARAEAEKENRILISDFSDDPADITTRRVMAGYAVMSAEARAQMDSPPTHVLSAGGRRRAGGGGDCGLLAGGPGGAPAFCDCGVRPRRLPVCKRRRRRAPDGGDSQRDGDGGAFLRRGFRAGVGGCFARGGRFCFHSG